MANDPHNPQVPHPPQPPEPEPLRPLSIPLTASEWVALTFMAKKGARTPHAWAREVIRGAIPLALLEGTEKGASDQLMDLIYRESLAGSATSTPAHSHQKSRADTHKMTTEERTASHLAVQAKHTQEMAAREASHHHACVFCKVGSPDGWPSQSCKGTCAHRQQFGAPCRWASTVAHQCPHFKRRHASAMTPRR